MHDIAGDYKLEARFNTTIDEVKRDVAEVKKEVSDIRKDVGYAYQHHAKSQGMILGVGFLKLVCIDSEV